MSFISKNIDKKSEALVNENIGAVKVLVIDEAGNSLGEFLTPEAIKMANDRDFDLVCVAPNAAVPVCRYMNYSKYRFEMQKRAREAKKNQKIATIKEIRLTPVMGDNDFDYKLKNGRKFLAEGDKVKVELNFRRRERLLNYGNPETTIMEKFLAMTQDIANVEQKPVLEGKRLIAIIAPKKK